MKVLQKSRQVQFSLLVFTAFVLLFGINLPLDATDVEQNLPSASVVKDALPSKFLLKNFPTVEQLPNYCGPAALSSVMNYFGAKVDQKKIASSVYDSKIRATNGADMLLYAREQGYVAYSWNSNLEDLKRKLVAGAPVIVLQDSSIIDRSGHFRVAVGYDDEKKLVYVMDPYEPETRTIGYARFNRLWERHGKWGLLVVPKSKDQFKEQLEDKNPVVHIDLAYVYYRKGRLNDAAEAGSKALALEPTNPDVLSLLGKVKRDLQYAAGAKSDDVTASKPASKK